MKSSLFALYYKEILKCRYAAGLTDLIKRNFTYLNRFIPLSRAAKAGRREESRCRGAEK